VVQEVNRALDFLKLAKHPDKTFIGRSAKGVDFLGYSLRPQELGVAAKTTNRFSEQLARMSRNREKAEASPGAGPMLAAGFSGSSAVLDVRCFLILY
jgi:hypothetical protein